MFLSFVLSKLTVTALEIPHQSKFVSVMEFSNHNLRAMIYYDFMKGLKVADTFES